MFNDCFNRIFDCSIRVSRSFATKWQRHSKRLGGAGPCQACHLATPQFETTVCHVLHISAILVSDYSCFMLVYSLQFWNYFCQNCDLLIRKIMPAY